MTWFKDYFFFLFFFFAYKEKRLSKAKVNNGKDCLRLSQVTGLIDWFGKHRLEIERATDMKCIHLCGLSCIQRFSSSQKQTWLMQDFFFRFNVRMTLLQTNSSRNLSKPSLSSIEISALFIEKKLFKYLLKELYKFIYFNLNLK